MPNVSRPSGERDTGLLSGPFRQARTRLTLMYVLILAMIALISSSSIYSLFSSRVQYRFARFHVGGPIILSDDGIPMGPEEVRADLIDSLLLVNGFLLVLAGVSSYWLAGMTLYPIQAAYDRQRRFLGDASHELRTPLAILQTDFENELAERSLSATSREQIESHLEEVDRMRLLVNDLLMLSRLDERKITHHEPATLEIPHVIEEAIQRLQSIAKREGITVTQSYPKEAIQGFANKELLMQALSNVIKNAILYNKRGGRVAISSRKEGAQAVITIADTGIGIVQEDLSKIFDRFYRIDESRSRETGGSGLGLAIVQSIMHQLKGSIEIESVHGTGTTVMLRIPTTKAS